MARIFYLMGSSGSGKDSLIKKIRQRALPTLEVAHRYITRDWQAGGENHVALTHREFENRQRLGMFALAWSANGQSYGIGREIEQWLAAGQCVLVNGSRGYLEQALAQYPESLVAIDIQVSLDNLEKRLINRGRESAQEIQQRLDRHLQLSATLPDSCLRIENNEDIDCAVDQLVALITDTVQARDSRH